MKPERITITIELGNAAMQDMHDVARALKALAARFAAEQEPTKVIDLNGNSVGTVTYE
jgi:hypothetical protein